MADLDYGELRVYPGNYDDYMIAVDAGARAHAVGQRQGEGADRRAAGFRAPLLGQRVEGAPGDLARAGRSRRSRSRTSSRRAARTRIIRFDATSKKLHRLAVEARRLAKSYDAPAVQELQHQVEAGERVAIIGPNGIGKTTLLRCIWRRARRPTPAR